MEIICPKILLVKGDTVVSFIAKMFEAKDEVARAFLTEPPSYEASVGAVSDEEIIAVKKIFAVCIAPRGQTFPGVIAEEIMKGWAYETVGGWYLRHSQFPFPSSYGIFTPGTIYLDEKYHQWVPVISPSTGDKFVGEVSMKEAEPARKFRTERLILISRVVKA